VTGDKAYREDAAAGADGLIAGLPGKLDPAQGETGLVEAKPARCYAALPVHGLMLASTSARASFATSVS
jgi:hypothetical protein